MRKSTKFLSALAVAGMIAASGSAFTAASTGLNDGEFVGYDTATVSGVTVSNVEYRVGTDASKLSHIVFTEAQDVSTGYKSILTINGPTTTQITCTASFVAGVSPNPGVGTITCPTTADVVGVNSISLTVTAI